LFALGVETFEDGFSVIEQFDGFGIAADGEVDVGCFEGLLGYQQSH
jgi:hypothetical protein